MSDKSDQIGTPFRASLKQCNPDFNHKYKTQIQKLE